jgi:hypothetical protein
MLMDVARKTNGVSEVEDGAIRRCTRVNPLEV